MKRLFATLLAMSMALSLAACGAKEETPPAASSAPAASSEAAVSEPAELSGDLVLYSSCAESDLDAVITAFNEKYPDIYVEVVNGSAGELTTRLAGEAANPVADVVWGGMADSDGDRYSDIFEAWVSEHDAENMPGYSTKNGLYSMEHLSTVVFCVNTELEAQLGLEIDSYEDLLDPALKGKILTADPNSSSSAWNNLNNIMAVYGTDSDAAWEYIEKLMPNLVIAGSSSACFKSVQQGEYVVGLTYEDGAVILVKDGATNIRLQYPVEGTSATAFGTALVKNGPNPENGKALVDFLCSAEGQNRISELQEGTMRWTNSGWVAPEGAWLQPTNEIKWVERDVEYMTENKDAILEHWNASWAKVMGG